MDLKAPTNWQELTPDQVRKVAQIVSGGLTREEMLSALFLQLANAKLRVVKDDGGKARYYIAAGGQSAALTLEAFADLCNRYKWVLDEPPCGLASPFFADRYLMDVTFEHYFRADAMMTYFADTDDKAWAEKALKELAPDTQGPFTAEDANTMELYWAGLRTWLKWQYPDVFAGEPDDDAPYSPAESRKNIMLMLNDGHPQDNEAIEQSSMHDVLASLQHKIEQAKRIEEKLKNN